MVSLWACSTDEIEFYEAGRYLYFTEAPDSISESFFFYPGKEVLDVMLVVRYAGKELEESLAYQLAVDDALTTARKDVDYELLFDRTMKKGQEYDTVHITLKKTDELEHKKILLALKLMANENFKLGPRDSVRCPNIIFTSQSIKPVWWDTKIESSFLGTYSEDKYELFIIITGISDMSEMTANEKRIYSLRLKNYLIDQKNAGHPVMDGNVEMSVPVL